MDPDVAAETVGRADFTSLGAAAQRRSLTVLTNPEGFLPLSAKLSARSARSTRSARPAGPRLYVRNVDEAVAAEYGEVVADPADADLAVLRLRTPHEPRENIFESFFHSGSLAFPEPELAEILSLLDRVPTLVCINLERPAVIPEIAERAAALIADYGAADAALLDVAFGRAVPGGRLPFELPRSMRAVEASRPDVPNDTENPVFPHGYGLSM
ncbi:glycoside hydrolase family 3 C-terminal domain-containing protein [Streptomyces sp. NPDC048258]|uniref:glycoside hydrolase family 3 C-terminal domain-containing protein n=1 Tax=Streptomyces sp. NPDC048258 TaxID=3365527 RepID=UPI0037202084